MPLSQTSSENPGAVHSLVASRLAREDEARMKELNRLTGTGPKESEMPKGIPNEPRKPKPCCGSLGQRHLATCKGAGVATRPTPERLTQIVDAANRKAKAAKGPDYSGYDVTQLLAIIVAAQAELERREQDLKEQLETIRLARAS